MTEVEHEAALRPADGATASGPVVPTLEHVARLAGVSIATASRVLTGSVPVSPERRLRVERAISDLGYVPDERARELRRGGGSRIVAFVVPRLADGLHVEVHAMLTRLLRPHGITLAAFETGGDPDAERAVVDVLLRSGARTLVAAAPAGLAVDTVVRLRRRDVRLLQFGDEPVDAAVSAVIGADRESFAALVSHLVSLGHRGIGHLAGDLRGSAARERLAGYRRALLDAGLPAGDELLRRDAGSVEASRAATLDLLGGGRPPTALAVAHPLQVVGVLGAARSLGLRVPHDLSLVSAFESEHVRHLEPRITAAVGLADAVAVELARLLVESPARTQQVVVRPEIAVRGSTAPPPDAA